MLDSFMSMREWLQPPAGNTEPLQLEEEPVTESPSVAEPEIESCDDMDEAIAAARRFRAALADTLDVCVDELLIDIAAEVLGRELALARCDLQAIVARALERYGSDPLTVRVHPDDVATITADWNVVADSTLRVGDVALEVRCGTIDATLGRRLARVVGAPGA